MEKEFRIKKEDIKHLISPMGGCIASDKITVEGMAVRYMYREEPSFDHDSGWRFFSGTETQDYIDKHENSSIYDVNTIANYDKSIIPYIDLPIGTELEKEEAASDFKIISQ